VGDSAFASKHPLHIFASAEAISHATYYGSLQGLSCTMHAVCTLCKGMHPMLAKWGCVCTICWTTL